MRREPVEELDQLELIVEIVIEPQDHLAILRGSLEQLIACREHRFKIGGGSCACRRKVVCPRLAQLRQ